MTAMKRERCWVWFRGGLNQKSHWEGGFYATTDDQDGVLIQHGSYRDTRVPAWRVTQQEPSDHMQPLRFLRTLSGKSCDSICC